MKARVRLKGGITMPAPVGLEEVAKGTQNAAVRRRQLAGAGVPWHTGTDNLQHAARPAERTRELSPPPLTLLSPAGPRVDQQTDTASHGQERREPVSRGDVEETVGLTQPIHCPGPN